MSGMEDLPPGRRGRIRPGPPVGGRRTAGRATPGQQMAPPPGGRGRGAVPVVTDPDKKQEKPKGTPPQRSGGSSPDSGEMEQISRELQALKLCERREVGKRGRPIPLRANFFKIQYDGSVRAQQYDVTVSCQRTSKLNKDECLQAFWAAVSRNKATFPHPNRIAYDGNKIAYALETLKMANGNGNGNGNGHNGSNGNGNGELTFQVEVHLEFDYRATEFTVKMKWACEVDLDFSGAADLDMDTRGLMLADIIFRQGRLVPSTNIPRIFHSGGAASFYRRPGQNDGQERDFHLGMLRQIWKGHFTSIKVVTGYQPMLNLDTAYTAFHVDGHGKLN